MIPRYSRPEMTRIWEPENRFKIWLEIETAAAEAMADLGLIPKEAAEAVRAKGEFAIERIDELGGAAKALDYMQDEIHRAAYAVQLEIESGEHQVVGVNTYTEDEETPRISHPDYRALEDEQVERLRALRASRDETEVSARLEHVRAAACGSDNILPHLILAVESGVTLGEVSDALRAEWGEFDG